MKITVPNAHNSPLVRPVGAVHEGVNECQAGNSPPDTGGVAAPSRKRCEATAAAQTGWSGLPKRFGMRSLKWVPFRTTPSAPSKEASRLLFDVASTPPMSGGEWRNPLIPICTKNIFLRPGKCNLLFLITGRDEHQIGTPRGTILKTHTAD